MPSFLNSNLEGRASADLLFKHILFSAFWIIGILLFVFRVDILVIERYANSLQWLKVGVPTAYFLLLAISCLFLKWYYIIALFLYPLLILFWFLPKAILRVGKVYLFSSYVNFIIMRLAFFKFALFNIFLFLFTIILLTTVNDIGVRALAIGVAVLSLFCVFILVSQLPAIQN